MPEEQEAQGEAACCRLFPLYKSAANFYDNQQNKRRQRRPGEPEWRRLQSGSRPEAGSGRE
jgi:hypothetical protein